MKRTYKIIFIIIFCAILQLLLCNSVFGKEEPILEVSVKDATKTGDNKYDVYKGATISVTAKADDGDGWAFIGVGSYSVKLDVATEGTALKETDRKTYIGNEVSGAVGDGTDNKAVEITLQAKDKGDYKITFTAKTMAQYIGAAEQAVVGTKTETITIKVKDPIDEILNEKAKEIDKLELKGAKCIIDQERSKDTFNKLVTEKIPELISDEDEISDSHIRYARALVERGHYDVASPDKLQISGFRENVWKESGNATGTAYVPVSSEVETKIKEAYKEQTGKELKITTDSLYKDTTYQPINGRYIQVWKYESKKLYNIISNNKVSETDVYYQSCDMFIFTENDLDGAKVIYTMFVTLGEIIPYKEGEDVEFSEDDVAGIEDIENNSSEMENVTTGFSVVFNTVQGEDREIVTFTDVITSIGDYIPDEEDAPEEFISKVNVILTVITTIGMIVSVLILAILGIKYMLGSVEEKAEYKKDMIPYIVGAFLLFGITAILKIVQQIGESFNNIP